MRAGQYDQLITLQRPDSTQAPDGGVTPIWVTVAEDIWASVIPTGGSEAAKANQLIAIGNSRIRLRWAIEIADMDATWRVLHDGAILNIKALPMNVRSERKEIELICECGANDG